MRLKLLRREHADYDCALLERNRDLFVGGARFAKNVTRYLPRNGQEPGDVYDKRCLTGADCYFNYSGTIVNFYASWLMTSKPELSSEPEDVDESYEEFKEDCTAKKQDLDHFMRHRFVDVLLDKRTFWRVEFPEPDPEVEVLRDYKEKGQGRAALVPVLAESVINWNCDEDGYIWLVEYQKDQGLKELDDDEPTITETWTVWRRDGEHRRYQTSYTRLTKPSDDYEVPEVELPQTWGQIQGIPLVEMTVPDELWLMNLIAGPQLENWRKRVGLSWSLDRTNYAMPVFKMKNRKAPPRMGAGYYLMIGPEDEVTYAAPPTQNYEVAQSYVDNVKDEIHRVTQQMAHGIDNNAAAVGRSAESKDVDDRQTEIVLSGFGTHVRDAIERTMDMIAQGRGEDITWTIGGLDNYHVTDATQFIANAQIAEALPVPSVTHKREMAKRISRVQMPDLDEPTRQEIDDQIDKAITDDAITEKVGPEDLAKKVDYTAKAANSGLLSKDTAVKHLADVFGHDPASESKAIEKQKQDDAKDDYGPMLNKPAGPAGRVAQPIKKPV